MLQQSPTLWPPWPRIVVQQRERLDGSGYPRGLPGSAISPLARILGAAEPTRPCARNGRTVALTRRRGRRRAAGRVRSGHLDGDAVDAVLAAAGHRVLRRHDGPAGLTTREVEVLRLVALACRTSRSPPDS